MRSWNVSKSPINQNERKTYLLNSVIGTIHKRDERPPLDLMETWRNGERANNLFGIRTMFRSTMTLISFASVSHFPSNFCVHKFHTLMLSWVWLVNVSFSMFMFLLVQFVHLTLVVWFRNQNIPKRVNKKHKSKWWIFVKLNLQNENTEKEKRWEDLIRIWFHFVHWLI